MCGSVKQDCGSTRSDDRTTHIWDFGVGKEGVLLSNFFNFEDRKKSESSMQKTWEDFRQQLANKDFLYNDIESACESTFLRVFNDLFQHGNRFFEKKVTDVFTVDTRIVRAAKISLSEKMPDYDRFIPNAKFITNDNRFSPPGVEWLYLAFSQETPTFGLSIEEMCALKECRAKVGDKFALCKFKLNNEFQDITLIDLTIAKDNRFEDINNELDRLGCQIARREIAKGYVNATVRNTIPKPQIDEMVPAIEKWLVFTYAKMLADQIFLPITTENRTLMYAPFQCMAQYFLSKGYGGIVYSSTVFPAGKNVVLFDKEAACPFGTLKTVTVPIDF